MQNLRSKSNPEDKMDVRWRHTLPTSLLLLLLSQGVIACRNWRPHNAHIHSHLIETRHSELEESQIMFQIFKIWDCKLFPPKPEFVQVTENLGYWPAFHRPSRGGVVEPRNDWRADRQERGQHQGQWDSSPLDTSMNSTFRLTHVSMCLPLSWPQSSETRVRPCSPDLVTRGYLHPSPPPQRATTPFSAAQGECACPQRTGWVRGPPLFGPTGIPGPVDWRETAVQDAEQKFPGSLGPWLKLAYPWEPWNINVLGLYDLPKHPEPGSSMALSILGPQSQPPIYPRVPATTPLPEDCWLALWAPSTKCFNLDVTTSLPEHDLQEQPRVQKDVATPSCVSPPSSSHVF